MKRVLCLVSIMGTFLLASDSGVGQQGLPPEKLKASGEHASFEWLFLPIGVARTQGLWTRNGLDPEFIPSASSAAQLRQQVEGGVKIGLVNTAEVLLARSQGTPVKIVAGYLGETVAKLFVRADSPMRTAKDLDGRKVGILSATHTSYRAVFYMNTKLGIKAETVVLGGLGDRLAALKAGTVDAMYSAEGAALTLVDSGELRILVALPDVYPRPYTAVVVWATDDLIEQKPDLVKRFVRTLLEAVPFLKEHPDQAVDMYMAKTGASRSLADRAVSELNKFLTPSGKGSGTDLVAAVAGNWQFTRDSGAIPAETTVNIEQAVDLRFLP
jgi:ABC-type nitrate/sulfonate/bicarbonate transport system substrate-binding protein